MSDNVTAKWTALQRWLRSERKAYQRYEVKATSDGERRACQQAIYVLEATLDQMRYLSQRKGRR